MGIESVRLDRSVGAGGWRTDWASVAVFVGAALYFAALVPYGFNLGEDGDVVYLIYRTFSGQLPYRDFASGYTPGFFYANATLLYLFGPSIVVIRWSLVVVNALATLGLYRLACAVMPSALAVVPAFAYVALMPVFPGEYATFNVPYPAWYVVLTWTASTLALLRGLRVGRARWIFAAGVLAAVGCAFKPNTGAFNLAALALAVLFAGPVRRGLWPRVLWWGLLGGVLVSIAVVFHLQVAVRDARLLLWPVFGLILVRALTPAHGLGGLADAAAFGRAVAALIGGFALVTLPWVLYYLRLLGTQRFLSDVLLIGSGHELFFYLPIRGLGIWDVALAVAGAAFALACRWKPLRRARPLFVLLPLAFAAMAGGALLVRFAPMPEGFWRAFMQRLQYLAFGAAFLVNWAAVLLVARTCFGGALERSATARSLPVVAVAVGAPLMYLSIYPRSDFFHWVLSAPLTVTLGVMLYWGALRRWVPPGTRAVWTAVPLYALILLIAWPGLRLGARMVGADPGSLARLGLPHAPIVLEAGRAPRLDDLRAAAEFINANSPEDSTLLGFPNLHFLNFLTGRQVPGRYGSFHPGWPDHVIEAEIINDLHARRTPLIVMNNDVQLYIGQAPLYYFLLRQYVLQNYEPAAHRGSYDILRLRAADSVPAAGPGGAVEPQAPAKTSANGADSTECAAAVAAAERDMPESTATLARCWRTPDESLQGRAVLAARATHDATAAVALAQALRAGTIAPQAALLAVRTIGEVADARAIPAMIVARDTVPDRVRDELDTALFNTAARCIIRRFMFISPDVGEMEMRANPASAAAALKWLEEMPGDPRLRFTGAWIAGVSGETRAVPGLRRMVEKSEIGLQMAAADALIRLGVEDGVIEPLLESLTHDEMLVPCVVLAWSQAHPERARDLIAETFRRGNAKQRETLAFIAGALGDRALGEVVREGLADPEPRVRIASVWTLGVLGNQAARADVERTRRVDPVEQVREFAQAGLLWLDEQRPPKAAETSGSTGATAGR